MTPSATMGSTQTAHCSSRSPQTIRDAGRLLPFRSGAARRASPQAASRMAQAHCSASNQEDKRSKGAAIGELIRNGVLGLAAAATVAMPATFAPPQLMPQAQAGLLSKDAVTNARALLRYALPVDEKKAKPARQIQEDLEGISEQLRIPGSKPLGPISKSVRRVQSILGNNKPKLVEAFAPANKAAGEKAIADLDASLKSFAEVLEQEGDKAKQLIPEKQQEALVFVGQIEEAMVQGFPFEVPAKYAGLPQLKGRATVEMDVSLKEVRNKGAATGKLRMVLDGYNAPVTAGNFLDLVDKKFYDNTEIQRADGFVVQTGDPEGDEDGYLDPRTKQIRRIPFEVMVAGDKVPVYEETLEDNGRFNEQPILPFNAFGTMALARAEFEANSGSSQIFWLLKESELTPTGSNLLDGRYAVFGYVVDGQSLLQDMQVGDKINKMYIVDGLDNLQRPSGSAAPAAITEAADA